MCVISTGLAAGEIDWEPDVYPRGNLFPALVIGAACLDPKDKVFPDWGSSHQGDPLGLVGASIAGLQKGDTFKLTVEANEFMKESTITGTIRKTRSGDLVVHPKISYDYERLVAVTQARPLDVTMELSVNGESLGKQTMTVTLRSSNDCLFGVDEGEDEGSDYSWLFSAYVNENHPWVDRILKEALETGIVSSFTGYQSGEENEVVQQIFAIWNVMQRRGMKYSDITTTAAERDGIYSQHVRFLDQSLTATQANCVDGSVLLAAVLRKIGLDASLVLIPGHMFLAVDLSDDTMIGIETTMMGDKVEESTRRKKGDADDRSRQAAWESFERAVAAGTETLEENAEAFTSDDLQYQIIELDEARRMGLLPIRFKSDTP